MANGDGNGNKLSSVFQLWYRPIVISVIIGGATFAWQSNATLDRLTTVIEFLAEDVKELKQEMKDVRAATDNNYTKSDHERDSANIREELQDIKRRLRRIEIEFQSGFSP